MFSQSGKGGRITQKLLQSGKGLGLINAVQIGMHDFFSFPNLRNYCQNPFARKNPT